MKHYEWLDNGETVETACGHIYYVKELEGQLNTHCPHCAGRVKSLDVLFLLPSLAIIWPSHAPSIDGD